MDFNDLPMTEVIGVCTMYRTRPDGVQETITVEIGLPMLLPADFDLPDNWYCPVRFLSNGTIPVFSRAILPFIGLESGGALIQAIVAPGRLLSVLPYAKEIDLSNLANFGFPQMPPRRALVVEGD